MPPVLTERERHMLEGASGEAAALAMRIVVRMAEVVEASTLLEVTGAHIDGCLYHGPAGLEFAERLAALGARVRVRTTLNVGSLDLLHPDRFRGDEPTRRAARRLMDAYIAMGCEPTWTCAPYQLLRRPSFGEHVAWAESNAIVFANSVLGARTERYGDFIDICAAITGRVPEAGLHLDEHRAAEVVFDVRRLPDRLLAADALYPVLGYLVGRRTGTRIPAIVGIPPDAHEDRLKALGAAAASSGSVALFHAVGRTPEAPTLRDAFRGRDPTEVIEVSAEDVRAARDALSTAAGDRLDAVSVGTPHASAAEVRAMADLLDRPVDRGVAFYLSTSRGVLEQAGEAVERCEAAGVRIVVDTCTYVTPVLDPEARMVMTDSAKWAHYAPGNLGVAVVFGTLEECVRSAQAGRVIRNDALWG